MAELLKHVYSEKFFELLTQGLKEVIPDFDKKKFLMSIFDATWEERELKDRMRHVSEVLKAHVSIDYKESISQILQLIAIVRKLGLEKEMTYGELAFMFIPEFISENGIEDLATSTMAFEKITPFTSCEFAVRPFIIQYEKEMMPILYAWANHENEHVRRLASEGSRSRLPWAMAIPSFKKDPSPVLPLLEKLKSDPSEYVRRSVANNLNDISKDNPQVLIEIAKKWLGKTKDSDGIIKHACRSLLKEGNTEVMQLFGFASPDDIEIINLNLIKESIHIGDYLAFNFQLQNHSKKSVKIRLEYAIYYMKKNGSLSKKVYKISEKDYAPESQTTINRRQSFKLISTRKFHAGQHLVSIIINGVEMEETAFELLA